MGDDTKLRIFWSGKKKRTRAAVEDVLMQRLNEAESSREHRTSEVSIRYALAGLREAGLLRVYRPVVEGHTFDWQTRSFIN